MFKSIAAKSITVIAAAGIVAGLAAFLTSLVPEAYAEPQVTGALLQLHAKGVRLPALVTGSACSSRSWPNYDHSCQFDLRKPTDEARAVVRIIALR